MIKNSEIVTFDKVIVKNTQLTSSFAALFILFFLVQVGLILQLFMKMILVIIRICVLSSILIVFLSVFFFSVAHYDLCLIATLSFQSIKGFAIQFTSKELKMIVVLYSHVNFRVIFILIFFFHFLLPLSGFCALRK